MKTSSKRLVTRAHLSNRRSVKKWKRAHPLAARAHRIVRRAIKNGTLIPQPCEVCGLEKVDAHHDETYADPLCVMWFCRKHHKEHHKKTRLVQGVLNFGRPKEAKP